LEQQNIVSEDTKPSILREETNPPKQPEVPEKKIDQPIENILKLMNNRKVLT